VTAGDADSASATAEQVRQALLGGASLDSLQHLYHDKELDKDGTDVPLDKLPDPYKAAIGSIHPDTSATAPGDSSSVVKGTILPSSCCRTRRMPTAAGG
jgi:hypothetical protein